MRWVFLRVNLGLALLISVFGCGYQFGVEGPGPVIGEHEVIQPTGPPVRLAIDPLQNRTFERDLEIKYTRYLRQQFTVHSGAKVVKTPQEAEFLLRGAIESVTLPSLTFTQTQTQESRVMVKVKVEVKNRQVFARSHVLPRRESGLTRLYARHRQS